eukprot:Pgem_evm1s2299
MKSITNLTSMYIALTALGLTVDAMPLSTTYKTLNRRHVLSDGTTVTTAGSAITAVSSSETGSETSSTSVINGNGYRIYKYGTDFSSPSLPPGIPSKKDGSLCVYAKWDGM